jgi:hypothetical protein
LKEILKKYNEELVNQGQELEAQQEVPPKNGV